VKQLLDELLAVGIKLSPAEMVRSALRGFPKEWDPFYCRSGSQREPAKLGQVVG
jgi:hypothetical protein